MKKKGNDAMLRLELVDVFGDYLGENVDILLRNQEVTDVRRVRAVRASERVTITGLLGPPRGLYRVEIDPPSYLPVSFFASAGRRAEVRTVFFAVDPKKIVRVEFPSFAKLPAGGRALLERSERVLGFDGRKGEVLYDALDDVRRAGLLNILAKTERTRLSNGRTVLSYLAAEPAQLTEIRGDRFYVKVPRELREETKHSAASNLFDPVSDIKHRPPDGFERAGSYKTPDHYANLQLTFFAKGEEWMADIDIDDANGIEHVFQVVRNTFAGPTNPFVIQQLLIRHQEIDPNYRLIVHSA